MSGIWAACNGADAIAPIDGALFRIVESQEQVATRSLVATLEEQAVLEDLLERNKPPVPADADALHYLLSTPFRYPPLRHGSRFGRRHEPSLFYGSQSVPTVLAEAAFYRLVFWDGMATPPSRPLTTQHTIFSARFGCARGIRLQLPPFDDRRAELTDRRSYAITQALGSDMREAGVEGFEFVSARDRYEGVNVALFTPKALVSRRPDVSQAWLAETSSGGVSFYCREDGSMYEFERANFLVDGELPLPAS